MIYNKKNIWVMVTDPMKHGSQWPFHEPKLEALTIYQDPGDLPLMAPFFRGNLSSLNRYHLVMTLPVRHGQSQP